MESLFLSRNQEHELIMTCIYDALVYSNMGKEFSVEEIMCSVFGVDYDEISFFVKETVIKSLAHVNEIKTNFPFYLISSTEISTSKGTDST